MRCDVVAQGIVNAAKEVGAFVFSYHCVATHSSCLSKCKQSIHTSMCLYTSVVGYFLLKECHKVIIWLLC